jgi:hypothetical protein
MGRCLSQGLQDLSSSVDALKVSIAKNWRIFSKAYIIRTYRSFQTRLKKGLHFIYLVDMANIECNIAKHNWAAGHLERSQRHAIV